MAFNSDSKIILTFYGLIILSLLFMLGYVDQVQDLSTRKYLHVGIGCLWAVSGALVSTLLSGMYQKTFWQLQKREQRVILIAVIIAVLGVYLVFKSLMA